MSGKPCCLHMPGKMIKLYPATKAILWHHRQSENYTYSRTDTIKPTHLAKPTGGGGEAITFHSLIDQDDGIWTAKTTMERPHKPRSQDLNHHTYNAEGMDKMYVRILHLQNHPVDFEDVLQWAIPYGLGGPGDRIPVEGQSYRIHPDRHWANPASRTVATGSLSRG